MVSVRTVTLEVQDAHEITYSHRQPPQPAIPLIWRTPEAINEPTMFTVLRAVQNQANLTGSSFDL